MGAGAVEVSQHDSQHYSKPGGVSLLRFGPDPSQGAPNPTYYQAFQVLMNVNGPTGAGEPLHAYVLQDF